MENRYF